ncbi:MAG: DNA translocase FtsK 4TM domain-containing protein, partial [Chlorobium sp.]|nr:DNA translocase FtsK 4TM domain-containing protein [Chlorobium sp.]
MLISLFLLGAILSFDAADRLVFGRLEWYDILGNGAREAVDSIHSPFGLLGARLSSFFVRFFLGYPSLLLLSAIFFWGLELFRSRSLKQALLFFLY